MPEQLNIYQRILAVMKDVDYIQKGDKQVNGQYRFVSHDQVVGKLHPYLVKHGVVVTSHVREYKQDGNRTEVTLIVRFINADKPEDMIQLDSIGFGIDGGGTTKEGKQIPVGDKGPGKAISYALKYALLKTFCLETGDDSDNDANVAYEPAICVEFDNMLPVGMSNKEKKHLKEFLEDISKSTNKHVEDIKREAIKRMPEFLEAAGKWKS